MEELNPQLVTEYAKLTNNSCSAAEICRKERDLLKVLGWRLNPDTTYFWLEYFIRMWDQFATVNKMSSSFNIKTKDNLGPVE